MEAQLWKARWKLVGKKYVLSLVDHPKVKATGAVLDEVVERFEELVSEKMGDAVPHFEFLEPLPAEPEEAGHPFIHVLAGHKCAEEINKPQLFQNGKCKYPKCEIFPGPRTSELIALDTVPKGDLTFTHYLGKIISARLAAFLDLNSHPEILLRPIQIQGKETHEFLELISLMPRDYVADRRLKPTRWGYRCPECRATSWTYMPYEAPFLDYVSRATLPEGSPKVFPIGVDYETSLAVDSETRKAIIQSKNFRNVVSNKVGVLSPEYAAPIDSYFPNNSKHPLPLPAIL